jgi:hypothetical protein
MRLRPANCALFVLAALAAAHCAPSELQTAGAYYLGCPVEQVSVYRAVGGVYVAQGCDHWTSLTCSAQSCVPAPQAEVHASTTSPR